MKTFFGGQRQGGGAKEPPMAPLIDMIFILLIFFLVTTSFVKESGVEVTRPIASTAEAREKTNMIVAVTKTGQVFVEGHAIDINSVRSFMERFMYETPGGSVVITADSDSMTGVMIQVLDACRLAGVRNVSVAAEQP